MPEILDEIINTWQASFEAKPFIPVIENAGSVSEVGDGVALVRGLSDAFISEVLSFEGGILITSESFCSVKTNMSGKGTGYQGPEGSSQFLTPKT
jgi:F0F1-type ATP synthase alpha subunit